jgi:hypothetical protein
MRAICTTKFRLKPSMGNIVEIMRYYTRTISRVFCPMS